MNEPLTGGAHTGRDRSGSANRSRGRSSTQHKSKKRDKRHVSPISSSDSDRSCSKKRKKGKKSLEREKEAPKHKKKATRASTWDMLAYLWPVSSRPAHLQSETEVNR